MNVYIESYGCTRRKLEVAKFHRYFALNGYRIVGRPDRADVILVTTCAFKHDEEEASIRAIDALGKYTAKIIVYGCLPAIAPTKYHGRFDYLHITPKEINDIDDCLPGISHKFAEIDDANLIDRKDNHTSLPRAIGKFARDFELSRPFIAKSCRYVKNRFLSHRRLYYLSTSRGCLGSCSYCAVRFAVGSIVSKPAAVIAREFSRGLDAGFTDFSILGDDVGAYGQDCGSTVGELMATLLAELDRPGRPAAGRGPALHIEEINPRWIVRYGEELVEAFARREIKSIICPLQSGSARILELMNRREETDRLLEILNRMQENNPELQLHTQLIVGFPTETDADFEESLKAVTGASFRSVVLFPYDDKESTPSFDMAPKVPAAVVGQRIDKAHAWLRQRGIKTALCCNESGGF